MKLKIKNINSKQKLKMAFHPLSTNIPRNQNKKILTSILSNDSYKRNKPLNSVITCTNNGSNDTTADNSSCQQYLDYNNNAKHLPIQWNITIETFKIND